jgi:hypothetical protein
LRKIVIEAPENNDLFNMQSWNEPNSQKLR